MKTIKVVEPDRVVVAVDTIILAIGERGLEVLLIKIKYEPYEGCWALPGSVVGLSESLDGAAKRVATQRVGDGRLHLEQLYCFGDPKRDARSRSVSVAYFALLGGKTEIDPKLYELYSEMKWYSVNDLPKMAFDHKEIVRVARGKLAPKLDEVEVIKMLLPKKFTLGELQKVHEILSGKQIDKRNFIKKVKNEGEVVATNDRRTGVAHRPAKLFRFK